MAGTLFVVATPIGHLDDITRRALRVLTEVSVVAAEDTRRTGNLLRHYGIPTRLISLHAHNERTRSIDLIQRLQRGESVAVVSDAGTPGIADPGAHLVAQARQAGIRVEGIPGPSAVATAVSVAGLENTPFAFLGFPPVKSKDRKQWLEMAARINRDAALVFFEAPHRIRHTLADLTFLGDRSITVFRELTKMHEQTLQGPAGTVAASMADHRGEFTVVVPRLEPTENKSVDVVDSDLDSMFGQLIESGAASNREAARAVGKRFGLSTREVYARVKKSTQ